MENIETEEIQFNKAITASPEMVSTIITLANTPKKVTMTIEDRLSSSLLDHLFAPTSLI
jgi:uncharacterized Rmd1/YagE family protein